MYTQRNTKNSRKAFIYIGFSAIVLKRLYIIDYYRALRFLLAQAQAVKIANKKKNLIDQSEHGRRA